MADKRATVQKSIRIPGKTARAIEELGAEAGLDFSAATNQLLEEAVRLRRCPGIAFTAGPSGRRATVAGTGLDVWEIVATYLSLGRDERRLREAYHWLMEPQVRAALAYYELYPEEVDARLKRDRSLTAEVVARRHPALTARPSRRSRRAR
ncbi:MAG: DUF433 domain-containing protein [Deltaproteobacteria bacterium]|nr:MAG: DUF433 domain-containing protein [Deltaproteobacteria bacterium]